MWSDFKIESSNYEETYSPGNKFSIGQLIEVIYNKKSTRTSIFWLTIKHNARLETVDTVTGIKGPFK